MSLDPELTSAIEKVAKELGQPPAVSSRLIGWLKDMSEREPTNSDIDQFVRSLLDSVSAPHEKD
jgi:hypothetical protein